MSKPKDAPPKDDLAAALRANTREANAFWFWRDRQIGEPRTAANVLKQAGVDVVGLVARNQNADPPDCEATLDGVFSGVELTELVDEETLAQSIRATRDREAGTEPSQPEASLVWNRDILLSKLRDIIDRKERKTQNGGPYERYALIVHTDETFLDRENTSRFLEGATFHTNLITDVFLGLSYHDGCTPVFHFVGSQGTPDGAWILELQPFLFVPRLHNDDPMSPLPPGSMMQLPLKPASRSRPSGEWNHDDYDVLAEGVVVGRIMRANAAPVDAPWLWTLGFGDHEDRTPTHGYAATREAAIAAFAKSWRRE